MDRIMQAAMDFVVVERRLVVVERLAQRRAIGI
jgi:hypothetical protein